MVLTLQSEDCFSSLNFTCWNVRHYDPDVVKVLHDGSVVLS